MVCSGPTAGLLRQQTLDQHQAPKKGNWKIGKTGYWKVTGRIDFKILISNFWPPGEGFQGFRPQIRLQHAKISMLTSFEVNWLQLKRFPKFCPVAFQWPVRNKGLDVEFSYRVFLFFLTDSKAFPGFRLDFPGKK